MKEVFKKSPTRKRGLHTKRGEGFKKSELLSSIKKVINLFLIYWESNGIL